MSSTLSFRWSVNSYPVSPTSMHKTANTEHLSCRIKSMRQDFKWPFFFSFSHLLCMRCMDQCDFFVATHGKDADDGTSFDTPLGTLSCALDPACNHGLEVRHRTTPWGSCASYDVYVHPRRYRSTDCDRFVPVSFSIFSCFLPEHGRGVSAC